MNFIKCLDVKSPNRGTPGSAGLDFFVPNLSEQFKSEFKAKNPNINITDDGINLYPQERMNIPSGIKASIPSGYALIAFNKSGVSLKYGLDVGACVIDEDYQGQIHLSLTNTSNELVHIDYGQKILQFIVVPVLYDEMNEVFSEEDCFASVSERGAGGYGSTGEA